MRYLFFISVCILTLLPKYLSAERYYFQTLKHGLSHVSATSIYQDSIGRIWLGNEVLNCYNGTSLQRFRLSDYCDEIEDENVHGMCGDASTLYLLCNDRLAYLDLISGKFSFPPIKPSSICYKDGFLYYVEENAFYRYDRWKDESILLSTFTDKKVGENVILPEGENRFMIGTRFGIYTIDTQSKKCLSNLLGNEKISFLFQDIKKNIWVVCRSGHIYIRDKNETFILQKIKNNLDFPKLSGDKFILTQDVTGMIWLGTMNGIYIISQSVEETGSLEIHDYVLPASVIFSLYSDHQGLLWVGSYYGNVKYINPKEKYSYLLTEENMPDHLHGDIQGNMCFDDKGYLYVATQGSGINVISPDRKKVQHLNLSDGLPNLIIDAVWYDNQSDRLFFTSFTKGLYYMNLSNGSVHPVQSPLLSIAERLIIKKVVPYKNSMLLLTQDGVFKMDRNTLAISEFFTDPDLQKLCATMIRAFYIDAHNILWISLYKQGLVSIDLSAQQILRDYGSEQNKESMITSVVVDICGDEKNGMFLATQTSGVMSYISEKDSFAYFTEQRNELLSNICYRLFLSNFGTLVVTSDKGISFLTLTAKKEFKSVYHIPFLSSSFPLVGLNRDCGLYAAADNDLILVGGRSGLLFLKEKEFVSSSGNYNMYFSSLSINGQLISCPDLFGKELYCLEHLILPYDKNTLSVTFATSDYETLLNTAYYEYKLEGLDEYWIKIDHNTITYSSLRPGSYTLVVRDLQNPDKIIRLPLRIEWPFYWSLPAILFYLLCISLLLFWGYWLNYSKIALRVSLDMKRKEIDRIEEFNRNRLDLFTNMSNEFRAPLTLILTLIDRIEHDFSSSNKSKLEKIKIQASRLSSLLSELTNFRKKEQENMFLHVDDYNLNNILKEIYLSYKEYASERQIYFRYDSASKDIYLCMV